jgi:starvation-inducible outer membrane lipoprotein
MISLLLLSSCTVIPKNIHQKEDCFQIIASQSFFEKHMAFKKCHDKLSKLMMVIVIHDQN